MLSRQTLSYYFITFIILLTSLSCNNNKKAEVERSYYFWKNQSYLEEDERNFLKQHHIQKLYTKILDVDWNDVYGAVPVSENDLNDLNQDLNYYNSLHLNIVPVVFITNKTFERIDTSQLSLLALRIVRKCLPAYDSVDVKYENNRYYFPVAHLLNPSELQFDCDWTSTTSKKYFLFLEDVKKLLPDTTAVSATIRLHQFKYASKTGVPPVDRGMLMLYNLNDPKKYESINSIFDYDKANAYFTSGKKYKLSLDVVLPAFSWGLIFRNQQFYQIENNLSDSDLNQLTFLQKESNSFYRVKADTVFNDLFLRFGDEIKPEEISIDDLNKAVELAHKAINSNKYSVALFDLTEKEVKKYKPDEIDKIYNSF
jgi:hypothetical protein